jgi:hypothetical protein
LGLDLCSSVCYCTTCPSPVGSPTSSESIAGLRVPNRRPCIGMWHARASCPRVALQPSPTMACGGFRRLLRFLLVRDLPSTARGSRVPPEVAPSLLPSTKPLLFLLLLLCSCFCCLFWAFLLLLFVYPSFDVWVIGTLLYFIQHSIYHLYWWPRFLASVPRIKRHASSYALPLRTFVLNLNFGLLSYCCCVFSFLM